VKLIIEMDAWEFIYNSMMITLATKYWNLFLATQFQKAELMERVDMSFFFVAVESDFVEDALVSCSSYMCTFL
jgi:hypothetical protein